MINSLLPNLRWLAIPSENLGQDWMNQSLFLDQQLEELGMDLAEEAVYLIYSGTPEDVLEGNGQCLIARSVIGPKRQVEGPLKLIDWKASPVWRQKVPGTSLVEMLESVQDMYFKAAIGPKGFAKAFTLCVKRELQPELRLSVETIFHE